jgi:Mg/Co/Ni transporter MgtE
MTVLLVRDVMTIGVPVCRETETCGEVLARLARNGTTVQVVVALDEDGMSCGWLTRERLAAEDPTKPIGEVMDEDIPETQPDIPAEVAAQIMRDRNAEYLFLMHTWPGEPRPSAFVSRRVIEQKLG